MRDFWYRLQYAIYWLLGLAMLAGFVYILYLFFPWRAFRFDQLDPRLPEAFHLYESPWVFWGWVVVLLSAAGLTLFRLRAFLRPFRSSPHTEGSSPSESGGWKEPLAGEIALPAGAQPADPVYFFLAATEQAVQDLFLAALGSTTTGRAVLTTQPGRAILINAASFSLLGGSRGGADAYSNLESLCRSLLAHDPEFPRLRGVFVVLPFDELSRGDPSELARRIRADLETIRRLMELEIPIDILVTGMEQVPGFVEFGKLRGPHEARQGRWGITLARLRTDDRDEPWQRLADFRFRVRAWTLDLIVQDRSDADRNARLHGLDHQLGSIIWSLAVLSAAACPASDPERPFLRRIDLVANGTKADEQAYIYYSVLHGPIEEDAAATRWTDRALAQDQGYRRRAIRIAGVGGALAMAVWLYIQLGLSSLDWQGWVILTVLASTWVTSLYAMWSRWPKASPERAD